MSEISYLIDKATSPLLLDIDWDTTLQIVDMIRQGDVSAKSTVNSLLPKIHDSNPNIAILALQVLESIMKNCGQPVHEEVATWDFMSEIRDLMKKTSNDDVQKKVLLLLATWVFAFRNEPKFRAVQDTVNILKAEGYKIPSVIESDAMFNADSAPDWADGESCHRCRSQFTMLRRKHHCRACGQVFCSDCSGKTSTIPKFGIEREVRVCEHCYDEINNPSKPLPSKNESANPSDSNSSKSAPAGDKKTADEIREEEELQLALALSKSEAENKEKEKLRATSDILGSGWRNVQQRSSSPPSSMEPLSNRDGSRQFDKDDTDPELAKYLNRSFWEQREKQRSSIKNSTKDSSFESSNKFQSVLQQQPSAPINAAMTKIPLVSKTSENFQNGVGEVDDFVSTLRGQLEIFVNRMRSNQSRGRPIANDTSVQSLFMNITAMHSQLLTCIQEQDHKRLHFEKLQDKISQIRDARAALDALREEHKDRIRREREEQERTRQIQMMQKLEIMRKKKQEYLEYQRQLAIHRMAESERQILTGHQQHHPNLPAPVGAPQSCQPPGFPPPAGVPSYGGSQGYPPPPNPVGGYIYSAPNENTPVPPFPATQTGQGVSRPAGPLPSYTPNPEYGHYSLPGGAPGMPPVYGAVPGSGPGMGPQQLDGGLPQQVGQGNSQSQPPLATNLGSNLQHPPAAIYEAPKAEEAPLISFD